MGTRKQSLDTTEILRRQRAKAQGFRRPVRSGTHYDYLPTVLADLIYFGAGFGWVLVFLIIPLTLVVWSA